MSESTAPAFSALTRLKDALTKANMSEDNVSFILGRLTRVITETVVTEVAQALGEEELKQVANVASEEEKMQKMAILFEQKTGKSITVLREEVTEKMVAEFEALE